MATTYCVELANTQSGIPKQEAASVWQGARRHRYMATINLAAQAVGDIVIALPQIGEVFVSVDITSSVSLATTTFGIFGTVSGNTYVLAGQTQTVTTPVTYKTIAAMQFQPLVQADTVVLRTLVAALPASGTLIIEFNTAQP